MEEEKYKILVTRDVTIAVTSTHTLQTYNDYLYTYNHGKLLTHMQLKVIQLKFEYNERKRKYHFYLYSIHQKQDSSYGLIKLIQF